MRVSATYKLIYGITWLVLDLCEWVGATTEAAILWLLDKLHIIVGIVIFSFFLYMSTFGVHQMIKKDEEMRQVFRAYCDARKGEVTIHEKKQICVKPGGLIAVEE